MTTQREVALLRLVAQRIAGAGFATAADAVGWLTCVQAQDFPGALTSVALRVRNGTRRSVEAALDAGVVVRSWPMRGTLHLVPAADLPWMLALGTPRILASTVRRRREVGIDDTDLPRVRELTVAALTGGGRLSRDDLLSRWRDAGQPTGGQRGAHLLGYLAMTGVVCLGPVHDGGQQVVLVDEWVREARRLGRDLDRDEALGEWALRYFRGHGPATVKDFTWWTKLLASDVKAGVAVARPRLETVEVDGVEHLMDPATPDLLVATSRQARSVFLLPGFDEYVLGYADRRAALPPEFAQRVCPGGNGMFLGSVVAGGAITGTWRRTGSGAKRAISATPFTSFSRRVETAIPRLFAALP